MKYILTSFILALSFQISSTHASCDLEKLEAEYIKELENGFHGTIITYTDTLKLQERLMNPEAEGPGTLVLTNLKAEYHSRTKARLAAIKTQSLKLKDLKAKLELCREIQPAQDDCGKSQADSVSRNSKDVSAGKKDKAAAKDAATNN